MKGFSEEHSEGMWPYWQLDFEFLVSIAVKEYISAVLSQSVCRNLLSQPEETNTGVADHALILWLFMHW